MSDQKDGTRKKESNISTLAVIPARYGSTRLPGKPLAPIGGVPLVLRVLDGVRATPGLDEIIVATDDERIAKVVRDHGGRAVMTPPDLPSGGDRVAWVAERREAEIVLNIQVDDPFVGPDFISPLVDALRSDPSSSLAVLAKRIDREEEIDNPNIVKMVFDRSFRALYFSRSRIPYPRNAATDYYKHIGPYAYRRDFLLSFTKWEQTPLEKTESLEMLRVLEMGRSIRCVPCGRDTIEIDCPEDVAACEAYIRSHGVR